MNTFGRQVILSSALGLALSAAPLKVVCFGDSTTAPRQGVLTYCDALQQEYGVAGKATILNRGVPGNTTAMARARFQKDVLDERPDLVFILFGLNDSSIDVWKKPPEVRPRVSPDDFRLNLRFFVDTLRSAGARVVLLTFNPMHWTPKLSELYGKPPYQADNPRGLDYGRAEYLAAIRQVASEQKVPLLDVNGAYAEYLAAPDHKLQDLLLDGIHPNSAGQKITTRLVRPIVESALEERGSR